MDDIKNQEVEQEVENEGLEDFEKGDFEEEPINNSNIEKGVFTNQLTTIVSSLVSRRLPEQYRDKYVKEYTDLNNMILGVIDFETAFGGMDISELDPKTRLLIGFTFMAGSAILLMPKEIKKEKENQKENYQEVDPDVK